MLSAERHVKGTFPGEAGQQSGRSLFPSLLHCFRSPGCAVDVGKVIGHCGTRRAQHFTSTISALIRHVNGRQSISHIAYLDNVPVCECPISRQVLRIKWRKPGALVEPTCSSEVGRTWIARARNPRSRSVAAHRWLVPHEFSSGPQGQSSRGIAGHSYPAPLIADRPLITNGFTATRNTSCWVPTHPSFSLYHRIETPTIAISF
jgi:hypothetical protein